MPAKTAKQQRFMGKELEVRDNRALATLDFGEEYRSTNGRFLLELPPANLENAVMKKRPDTMTDRPGTTHDAEH